MLKVDQSKLQRIHLRHFDYSWSDYEKLLPQLIEDYQLRSICEIGAGPNPSLSEEWVKEKKLEYLLTDIDEEELGKGKNNFRKACVDFSSSEFQPAQQYDLIFSKMVLEHLVDPAKFHANVAASLKKGGIAFHFFATKYGVPSLANLALPEAISSKIVYFFQRRDPSLDGKFEAHYRWCLGPVKENIQRFENIGFEVLAYNGYLGHDYLRRSKILLSIEKMYSRLLCKFANPYLTSNANVILRKKS